MQNWNTTLLSQYANSPTLYGLLDTLNQAVDPSTDIQNFYSNLWNINTASGQGLNNWGQIVGVSRNLSVPIVATYFGFNEASGTPFGVNPLYSGPLATQTYTLSDKDYRSLIMLKAAANISTGAIPILNSLLSSLFGSSGRAYVQDTGSMTMRFVLDGFTPSTVQLAILTNAKVIPRSAGVKASVMVYPGQATTFGFSEAGGLPFGVGTFMSTTGISNVS